MAIIVKNYVTEEGVKLPEAYIKPLNILLLDGTLKFQIAVYADRTKRALNFKYFKAQYIIMHFDSEKTVHNQIYDRLKSMYTNSEDC